MKATFGALLTMLVAASASPISSSSHPSSVQIAGSQLQSLINVLASHSSASRQDIEQIDQNISCTVAYTLALSMYMSNQYLRTY